MSREKSEKVCITFRLSEEEHEKLKQYSSACGLSTADVMRQLCRGNAPQPQPAKAFWELLGTLYELHVAIKKCIPYAPAACWKHYAPYAYSRKDVHYRDITEKIGGTQYSVNVHFREDGRDLLGMLTGIFNRNISVFEYGYEDYGGYDDEE